MGPFISSEAISQWDFCEELLTLFQLSRPVFSKSHHLTAISSCPQLSSTTKSKVTSPVFCFCRVIALPPFSQQLKQKLPSLAGNPQTCYCSVPFALLSPGPSSTHFFSPDLCNGAPAVDVTSCLQPFLLKPAADSFLALQHLPRTFLTPGLTLGGMSGNSFAKYWHMWQADSCKELPSVMQQVTAQISGNPCLFESGCDFLFRLYAVGSCGTKNRKLFVIA